MSNPNQPPRRTDANYDPRATRLAQSQQRQGPNFYPQTGTYRRRKSRRTGCLKIFLVLIGISVLFGMVGVVVAAIVLPPTYRDLKPEQQAIWCNRSRHLAMDFVCDWKPTPPFKVLPTLAGGDNGVTGPELLQTLNAMNAALTGTPSEQGGGSSGTGLGTLPPPPTSMTTTPTPTATSTIPATATLLPTAIVLPSPTFAPLPTNASLNLSQLKPEAQWWNNCGPTNLTMALSYFGYSNDQGPAASFLKPNREDKNVSPWQMVSYVNEVASQQVSVNALWRVGGNQELLKRLLVNNFPVIIEKGYELPSEPELGWMGHYLLLVGYNDDPGIFLAFDSYLGTNHGQGRQETYAYVEQYWQQFNYPFIVLYSPDRQAELMSVLGEYADETQAIYKALDTARAQASANPNDKWAWFNMGESLTMLKQYQEAASAFDQAFQLQLPWRTLWYHFTPFEAYYNVGRYEDVVRLANDVDRSSGGYVEEASYYRGLAYAAQTDFTRALTQFENVLRFNPNFTPAAEAITAVQSGTYTPPVVS
ncbi:MAG: C39 family peptidase [Chloroflexi bacterium]|nr:C39 family peptidase [Chloroflexota bacterium]